MKIVVTGSTGFIGSALVADLRRKGHAVNRLVRKKCQGTDEFEWNPEAGSIDPRAFQGVECVVHLAGAGISQRWTASAKHEILQSRLQSTRLLCNTLVSLHPPPHTLISASGVGYYGNCWEQRVGENGERGQGFLSDVAAQWEEATAPAASAGLRVVNIRLGMVLGAAGGALPKLLTPFKLGLGCTLGSGIQFMSWISIEDATGAIRHIMDTPSLTGPVNLVSPHPARNQEFSRLLGKALHRPVFLKAPAFILKAILGEMADDLLLASTAAIPKKLTESGYVFRYPELGNALLHTIGSKGT